MIKLMLAVLICSSAADCQWNRVADRDGRTRFYNSERECEEAALYRTAVDRRIVRYKCVFSVAE